MALVSDAAISFQDGTSSVKEFGFEIGGAPAALGFSLAVDAMCIRLRFPEAMWSDLSDESELRYRAMRTARFHDQAVHGQYLEMVDNPFAREWLAHLLLAALSNEAIAKSISLEEAAANLAGGRADLSLDQTLNILFQSAVVDDINAQSNVQDQLRQDLAAFLADPQVNTGLFSLATILWTPIAAHWEPWLSARRQDARANIHHTRLPPKWNPSRIVFSKVPISARTKNTKDSQYTRSSTRSVRTTSLSAETASWNSMQILSTFSNCTII